MDQKLFAEQLAVFTSSFLRNNPNHPDFNNIQQYLDVKHSMQMLKQYETLLAFTRGGSAIDVGSGVGYAKVVDDSVYTANPPIDYQVQTEQMLGVERDFDCADCRIHSKWIGTDDQYDFVILHRFMPWADQEADPLTVLNIFTDVRRILKPDGKLIYTPISTKGLKTTGWKRINTGMQTFEINTQQLYDAILTANKILQTRLPA
jgi:SAM-dependent methyltransferase